MYPRQRAMRMFLALDSRAAILRNPNKDFYTTNVKTHVHEGRGAGSSEN